MSERLTLIQAAVEQAAECAATHLETVAVIEVFRGQVMWDGEVEVFTLHGHPRAKKAYGWTAQEGKEMRYVAVLEIPPVTSPNTAVRASIVAAAKK